jgi:glycosyltransferase involved in cell wall biosynthesis
MSEIRASAIIPTYNRAELTVRAVESALAQTSPPIEILVVDDGSTDDTREAMAQFGSAVRYVYQPNAGVAAACNTGARQATGDWISFLDSDDVWLPSYFEQLVTAIETTGGGAELYFADITLEGSGSVWEEGRFSIEGAHELREDPADWLMLPLQPMTSQGAMIRRETYLQLGGMETSLLGREDTHLFFRIGLAGPACAVAGVAAEMTDDAAPVSRLTAIHRPTTRTYCEQTIWLYKDVLDGHPSLTRRHRRVLRRRLAAGYWDRARLELHDMRFAGCVVAATRSCALAPTVAVGRTKRWIVRHRTA